jgi:hypothetical protein
MGSKNIPDSIDVFRLYGAEAAASLRPSPVAELPIKASILRSSDRPAEAILHSKTYPKTLSKITLPKALLDVITNLSRFRSIDVIARGSSFAFRDREISIKEIGQQLQSAIRDRRERAADWLACSRAITEAAQSRLTRLAGSRDDLIPAHYVPRDEPFHDAEQQIKQRKSFGDGLDMKSLTSEEDLDTSSGAYSGPVCRT